MSLSAASLRNFKRITARVTIRPSTFHHGKFCCSSSSTPQHDSSSSSMLNNNYNNRNKSKPGMSTIDFTLKLFQSLHSRDLMDVMNESFSNFSLTREQSLSILNSDLFITLNHQIVISLLTNASFIVDNVSPEELWQSLRKWCQSQPRNDQLKNSSISGGISGISGSGSDENMNISNNYFQEAGDYEWLSLMRMYVPFIKFEEMDIKYFMQYIETIPDSYNIITKDQKYRIMKQQCLKLIETNDNEKDNAEKEAQNGLGYQRLDRSDVETASTDAGNTGDDGSTSKDNVNSFVSSAVARQIAMEQHGIEK